MKKRLSYMERKNIENRAKMVLQALDYRDGEDIYIDAVRLARFFGFQVEESNDLPETEDGSVTVSRISGDKNIVVNNIRSFETKRFIIVHELAHYLLHYTKNAYQNEEFFKHRENKKGKSIEENDADYLAACLLMPEESFRTQYKNLIKNHTQDEVLMELQRKFRTPQTSISRRIDEVCKLKR